ncbi:hypothetical protein HMPREF1579_01070 [Gardnerella vaginalis JCP8066]|nr:hypothetical protein HMPREF1586_01223 [Gardnerella vaginalis JCP8522]EPI58893.1 hypothetical protein HMPREF1579_01070 [Gardnerella vaginalis JCP8066]
MRSLHPEQLYYLGWYLNVKKHIAHKIEAGEKFCANFSRRFSPRSAG